MFKLRGSPGSPNKDGSDSLSSSSTPPRSKSEKSASKNKNPYAMSGRDKFADVLADLDMKRRIIYEQVGTQDISKVRFGYCDSKRWVPIVVRSSKDRVEDKSKHTQSKDKHVTHISEALNKPQTTQNVEKEIDQPRGDVDGKTKLKSFYGNFNLSKWIQPCYDSPMVFVLVLSCLGVYGRLLAIIGAAIWWFLVPRFKNKELSMKELLMKKIYGRASSEKRMSNGISSPRVKQLSQEFPPRFSSPKTNMSSPRHHHAYNKSL